MGFTVVKDICRAQKVTSSLVAGIIVWWSSDGEWRKIKAESKEAISMEGTAGVDVIDFRAVVLHSYSCDADQINGKTKKTKKPLLCLLEQGQKFRLRSASENHLLEKTK